MRPSVAWWVAVGVLGLCSSAAGQGKPVHDVKVSHYSGQTFITWTEDAALTGETYRVYRSDQPIDQVALHAVELRRCDGHAGGFHGGFAMHQVQVPAVVEH